MDFEFSGTGGAWRRSCCGWQGEAGVKGFIAFAQWPCGLCSGRVVCVRGRVVCGDWLNCIVLVTMANARWNGWDESKLTESEIKQDFDFLWKFAKEVDNDRL